MLKEKLKMMNGVLENGNYQLGQFQFDKMEKEGKLYPYAEHLNTICNGKILNLPKDFTQGPRPAGPRITPAPRGRRPV